jgi:hypothetical protein
MTIVLIKQGADENPLQQIISKGQFFSLHRRCSSHPKNQNNERPVQKNLYVYAHHSRICPYFLPIPGSRK